MWDLLWVCPESSEYDHLFSDCYGRVTFWTQIAGDRSWYKKKIKFCWLSGNTNKVVGKSTQNQNDGWKCK